MKNKCLNIFLLIVIVLGAVACKNNGSSSSIFSKELNVKDLSINDFSWKTKSSKCDGYDCYVLSLTNNSKYDVIGVDLSYKVKAEVTESQLSIYDDFMSAHNDYIEEGDTPKEITLRGSKNQLVKKGETLTDLRFTIGYGVWYWYDYPTDEQFNLMEPSELQIGIVSNNKLYIAYYDFQTKNWKLDEETVVVDVWSKRAIAKQLNKPKGSHFVVLNDEDYEFEIYSYGISKDMYKEYIKTLKSSGFIEDDSYSSIFLGENSNGNIVEVRFGEREEYLRISIREE